MTKSEMLNRLYQVEISMRATLVLNYLINRANVEMTCFPAIRTIAKDCNMSTRTVQRAVNDLMEAGLVEKNSRYRENGGQSSNLYTLCLGNSHGLSKGDDIIEDKEEYLGRKKGNSNGEIVIRIKEIGFGNFIKKCKNNPWQHSLYRKENLNKHASNDCHRVDDNNVPP